MNLYFVINELNNFLVMEVSVIVNFYNNILHNIIDCIKMYKINKLTIIYNPTFIHNIL